MNGPQLGLIIPAAFGAVWAIAGTAGLPPAQRSFGLLAALAVTGVLIVAALKAPLPVSGRFDATIFGVSVALEAAAIVIAVAVLNRAQLASFILPVIAIIVGLHFLGMWRATGEFSFVWLAVVLCAIGAIALPLPPVVRRPVAGLGAAFSLWGAVTLTLLRA